MKKILLLLFVTLFTAIALVSCSGDGDKDDPCKDGHSFTSYVSNGDATCIADGTKTAKCDRCDLTDTVTDEGTKTAHKFESYVSDGNATCTEDGTKTARCETCNAADTVEDAGSKKAHSFLNYISNGDATCMKDGTKTSKCDGCDLTDTVTDVGSKKAHKFSEYTDNNDATCTSDGTETAKCDTEGCTETHTKSVLGSAKTHDMSAAPSVTKNPTCTEKGEQKLQCKNCSYFTTSEIPALGHDYIENGYKVAEGHADKCSVCGAWDTDNLTVHTPGPEATEENPQLCTDCGYVITPAIGHIHNYSTRNPSQEALKKPASCTDAAQYYFSCSCGNISFDDNNYFESGEKKDHEFTDATCVAPKTCKNCGETEGDPTGLHNYADATCTAPKTCTVCGAADGEPLSHKWEDATCVTAKHCSRCGAVDGEPLPHTWREATCTLPKTCAICDKTEGEALGHTWSEATCTVPKTCEVCHATEGGLKEHVWKEATCTEAKKCILCEAVSGSALGHDYGEWVTTKEATTTSKGERERECKRCDHKEHGYTPKLDDGNSENDGPGENMDPGGWTVIPK